MRIDVYHHSNHDEGSGTSDPFKVHVVRALQHITERMTAMSTALDAIKAQVGGIEAVVNKLALDIGSNNAELAAIKAALDAAIAAGNPIPTADLQALADRLGAVSTSLGSIDTGLILANATSSPTGPSIKLPDGIAGQAYSATLDPIPGSAPFTNSATGLPAGMVADKTAPLLSAPAADAGATPPTTGIAAGDYAILWTSTDSDPGTPNVTRAYALHVAPAA